MTTIIVTEDNIMCSDTQLSIDNFIPNTSTVKIENIDGYLVGAAGVWPHCLEFREWIRSEIERESVRHSYPMHVNPAVTPVPEVNPLESVFTGLVLSPEGELTVYENYYNVFPVDKPYAIGTGAEYALCALDAGASAEEALKIAMKRDVYTGGEVYSLHLESEEGEV